MAQGCNAKKRCLVCAGEHLVGECTGENPTKCANCGGNHKVSYNLCPAYLKFIKKVDPRLENPNIARNSNFATPPFPNTMTTNTIEADIHNTQGSYLANSYADAAADRARPRNATAITAAAQSLQPAADYSVLLEAIKESQKSTVREINRTIDDKLDEIKRSLSSEIDRKLKENNIKTIKLLHEVLSLKFDTGTLKQKGPQISSAIRSHYGEDMWEPLTDQINASNPKGPTDAQTEKRTNNNKQGSSKFTFRKVNQS